jgi:Gpi18-like mannosyltransferase
MTRVLLVGTASRILVFLSAIVGSNFVGIADLPEGVWTLGTPIVKLFSRWDAGWYMQIAMHGYPAGSNPVGMQWAWFPLYPALMRFFGQPLMSLMPQPEAVALAGFLVSNAFFFVSIALFYKLSETVLASRQLAFLSTVFFVFWPGSLFYSCVYSESLFMTLMLGAFYLLEKNKSFAATPLAFLAGLARSNGFLVAIPFAYKGIEKRNYRLIFQSVLVCTSYLLFSLYGYFMTGVFPVREIAVAQYWVAQPLVEQLLCHGSGYALMGLADLFFVLLPFIYLFSHRSLLLETFSIGFKRTSGEAKYFLFALINFVAIIFFSNSVFLQLHRYAMPLIPVYWVLARLWFRNRKIGVVLLTALTVMLSIGAILFATWHRYL